MFKIGFVTFEKKKYINVQSIEFCEFESDYFGYT